MGLIMPMQNSAFTNQDIVLSKVVDRLRSQIVEFNAKNTCFVSLDPEPEEEQRQSIFATVSPIDGEYDQGTFDGAGRHGVLERSGFTVTVFSLVKLDRPDEQFQALQHESRGLLILKKKVLQAILVGDDGGTWMPTNASGASLLTDFIAPVRAGFPMAADNSKHAKLSVTFLANWQWDLSE